MGCLLSMAAVTGDVDNNGTVDGTDLNVLINIVLGHADVVDSANVNGDNAVDGLDVNMLINILLGNETPEPPVDPRSGRDRVWDMDQLPEIHLEVSLDQWNALLSLYDGNAMTKQYVEASQMTMLLAGETYTVSSPGLRIKGNTSRRRPEGNWGESHRQNGQLRHFHIGLNLRKYYRDDEHTVLCVRKFHLKWFKDDPMYVRELFCYNIFREAGVWTAPRDNYCRLWIKIEGDTRENYMGVYEMIEPIDGQYIKDRGEQFELTGGNLWKCKYSGGMASLATPYNSDYWWDDDSDDNHTYTLQTNTSRFEAAKAQLIDFQLKLNGKGRESFYTWIQQVCDVDLLLHTYAVNVAVGMWDDYWNNGNNYYLYFTTEDLYDYKVYLLPYDYDNTLGTSLQCGVQTDAGRQNPLQWGLDGNQLIKRLLEYDDFKAIYVGYLKELVDDDSDLMHFNDATARIVEWQDKIRDYVDNDTGEDTRIYDQPAYWGNHHEYRLLNPVEDVNFFKVKAESINQLQ
jgi:spore coat protein CotH